jgi:hypothetical protein
MSSALVLAAVPILLAASLLALMKVPANIQLTVTEAALVIEPQGPDRWWTRRDRISVPIGSIASIRIIPRSEAPAAGSGVRPGELGIAGVITAGVHGTTFWDVRRGDQLLLITCRPGAEFASLVLELPSPFATLTRTRTVIAPAPIVWGHAQSA